MIVNLLTSVFFLVLWSSQLGSISWASTVAPASSVPIQSPALKIDASLKYIDSKMSSEIQNMPSVQSQDTVGSCFGCAPATIVQKYLCDNDPEIIKISSTCNQLPRDKVVSQLSLIAWADTNKTRAIDDPENRNQIAGETQNHKNIKLYEDTTIFSSGSNALMNSVKIFKFMPESCYPFDQLVLAYGTENSALFYNIYQKTKMLYTTMKREAQGSSNSCNDCLKQLSEDFRTPITKETLNSALTKETFGEFLYTLIFKNCKPITSSVRPTYNQIPNLPKEILNKNGVFNAMKKIIDNKKPILINAICLKYDSTNTCTSRHSTVISGYRRMCPTENTNDINCKNQLKIHNCWGKDWQTHNNDGWVDSESLIKHLNYGKEYITAGELSWLE